MVAKTNKAFEFDMSFDRAYKSPEGKMHIVAIASDDEKDRTGDRMAKSAVQSMARQATEQRLGLLPSHRDAFEFGVTTSAVAKKAEGTNRTEFVVDIELDSTFPQSLKLFQEVQTGKSQRQLSIGGFLDRSDPNAVSFMEEDGHMVRVINDITLEHIAVTRPGMAAVPRTRFVDAVIKDLWENEEVGETLKIVQAAKEARSSVSIGSTGTTTLGTTTVATPAANVVINVTAGTLDGVAKTSNVGSDTDQRTADEIIKYHLERGLDLRQDWLNSQSKEAAMADLNTQATETVKTEAETAADASAAVAPDAAAKTDEQSSETAADEEGETAKTEAGETPPTASLSKEAQQGLSVIEKLGSLFKLPAAAEPELPEEIQALQKAWEGVARLKLEEKSLDAVARLHGAMVALLSSEGQFEEEETVKTVSAPAIPVTIDSDAISKAIVEGVTKALLENASPSGTEEVKKEFGMAFTALTESLAKSLTEMGEGFKGTVQKTTADLEAKVEKTAQENGERISTLEKAAGVRQSAPANEAAVAQGGSSSVRSPDANNPFRGIMDGALVKAGMKVSG